VILCGPAACGKSTFAARHFRPTQIVSSDKARALVCDDERDQRHSAEAFALVNFIIEQRLSLNRLCVVDSTALTPESRRSLFNLARKYGVPCVVFLFDIPLETCVNRDQARERSVGQQVIERQHRLFVQERGNIEREGFDQVIKLSEDDLDKLRIDVLFRPMPKVPGPSERPQPRRAAFRPGAPNQRGHGAQRGPTPPYPRQPALRPTSGPPPPGSGVRDSDFGSTSRSEPPASGSRTPSPEPRNPSAPSPAAGGEALQPSGDSPAPSKP
jgi:protein phosphatase